LGKVSTRLLAEAVYNYGTQQIVGLNNKCLDSGLVSADPNLSWLRINDCNSGGNQKFWSDQFGRIHNASNPELCIDSYSGNTNNSKLYLSNCHFNDNQRWGNTTFTISTYVNNVGPTPKYTFRQNGSNQCLDASSPFNGRQLYTWDCNGGGNQLWDWVPSGYNNGRMLRRSGTNFCVDAYQAYDGRLAYTWQCESTSSNHNWFYNNLGFNNLMQQNTNLCLDAITPYNGRSVYTWTCANVNNHNWVASYVGTW
jgi:hypothetical protein